MPKTSKQNKIGAGENLDVEVARLGLWQAVLVALISAAATGFTVYFTSKQDTKKDAKEGKPVVVVPLQNSNIVKELPEESNSDLYELKKDISIFDLRQWKGTPDSLKNTRYSPANYTNYFHMSKTKPLDKIVIHYGTSGFGIDMRCITNAYKFYQKEKPTYHDSVSSV